MESRDDVRGYTVTTSAIKVEPRPHANQRSMLVTIALVVLLAAAAPLAFLYRGDHYGLASNRPAADFMLRDTLGQARSLADFHGQYVYLMFGYLNCPDVCHTQALLFEEIALAAMDAPIAFAYIAIDPERDSPEQVARYFDSRGAAFTSLHGTKRNEMQAIANAYGAYFAEGPGKDSGNYAVNHSALFFLLGPDGNLRYSYLAAQNAVPELIGDLQTLQREYNRT